MGSASRGSTAPSAGSLTDDGGAHRARTAALLRHTIIRKWKASLRNVSFAESAFTDGRALAIGSTGEIHPRSSMSLINVAYRDALTWANPSLRTFEDQLLVPLFGTKPVELGLQGHESKSTRFSQRIRSTKTYSPRRFLE